MCSGRAAAGAQLVQRSHPSKKQNTSQRVSHPLAGRLCFCRLKRLRAPSTRACSPSHLERAGARGTPLLRLRLRAPAMGPAGRVPAAVPAHPDLRAAGPSSPLPRGRARRLRAAAPAPGGQPPAWGRGAGAGCGASGSGAPRVLAGPLDFGRRRGLNRDGS